METKNRNLARSSIGILAVLETDKRIAMLVTIYNKVQDGGLI